MIYARSAGFALANGGLMSDELLHRDLTDQIIGAFYKVYTALGYGFLEKVYENSLAIELHSLGLKVEQQKPIKVYYDRYPVGDYFADLIVEDKVILELKAAELVNPAHAAQLQNYLKATDVEVGLLFNFGHKPEFRRKVFTNARKVVRNK
jgi:GxxExxY protein